MVLQERYRASQRHQVWAMNFQFDATADGRRIKFLNVIDEHSRFCLAIRVGRRCKANDVVTVLEELRSTSSTGRIRPSRGVRPWRQINRELPHDHHNPLS